MIPSSDERAAFARAVLDALECPASLVTTDANAEAFLLWAKALPQAGSGCDARLPMTALAARVVLLTESLLANGHDVAVQVGAAWQRLSDMPLTSIGLRVRKGGTKGKTSSNEMLMEYERLLADGRSKAEARQEVAGLLRVTPRAVAEATREKGKRGRPRAR